MQPPSAFSRPRNRITGPLRPINEKLSPRILFQIGKRVRVLGTFTFGIEIDQKPGYVLPGRSWDNRFDGVDEDTYSFYIDVVKAPASYMSSTLQCEGKNVPLGVAYYRM